MIGWESDKEWSDRFLHEIKGIIGQTLIGEPPIEEDQQRNTDLIVLKMDAVRIGCRIRRNEYMQGFRNEFTLRASRPSGTKTELAKIIEGWGDYFFYGFSDENEESLAFWFIGDLCAFRIWHTSQLINGGGKLPGQLKKNRDGSSGFYVYQWNEIQNFVINQKSDERH